MKKLFSLLSLLLLCAAVMAQTASIKFEGLDANGYIKKLDQIEVINLTKSWQVTLYWPDTVLTIQNGSGIEDVVSEKSFALLQNNPNPFDGTTYATLQVAEAGSVSVEITDMAGRSIGVTNMLSLQPGTHQLRVTLVTAGVYFLTAHQEGSTSTVKMVCRSGSGADAVAYAGMTENTLQQKSAPKGTIVRPFDIGDRIELKDGTSGVVKDINLRHVVLAGMDSIETIVPNSLISSMSLSNMSKNKGRRSAFMKFAVAYGTDVEKAMDIIRNVVISSPYTIEGYPGKYGNEYGPVYFLEYGESALILATTVYHNRDVSTALVLTDINLRINRAFKANGIEIPFNYLNVVMKDEAPADRI